MPNLKAALAGHQHNAKRAAALKKAADHQKTKADSIKASVSGAKKAKKRAARVLGQITASTVPKDVGGSSSTTEARQDITSNTDDQPASTSTNAPITAQTAKGKGKEQITIPFQPHDTILLLGEANFSFARSVVEHHNHPAHQVLATSYDSEETCYAKYPDARENVRVLTAKGVGVEFGVDGGKLEGCKKVGKGRWSRVIMNFPHTGSGIKDQDRNIRDNQLLLLRVLTSVAPVLTAGPARLLPNSHTGLSKKKSKSKSANGKKRKHNADSDDEQDQNQNPTLADAAGEVSDIDIDIDDMDEDDFNPAYIPPPSTTFSPPSVPGTLLITLLDQAPYTLWALRQLATRPPHSIPGSKNGIKPARYALLRSFKFVPEAYPGYAHRRTLGWREGLSKDDNEEIMDRKGVPRTWEFALNLKEDGEK